MKLSQLIQTKFVFLDVAARGHRQLIDVLAELLTEAEPRLDRKSLREGLMEREALGGTVIGGGVILPHARVAPEGEEMVAFARLAQPLDMDAPDGEPIWLAAISLTDPNRPERHLQLLAQLAKVLHNPTCIEALRTASEPQTVVRVLLNATAEKTKRYQLVLVTLPDDEAVQDLLNLWAGIGIEGATSVTARGMMEILSSGPTLFAGFRELFGAVGSARLVISALESELLDQALDVFKKFKKKRDISGVAFHLPLGGVVGLERNGS